MLLAAAAAILLSQPAVAAVSGYNPYLELTEGNAYIPMKPSSSGMLGELVGNKVIGAQPDTVTLSDTGDSTAGFLSYNLFFNMAANRGPSGEPIFYIQSDVDTATMNLYLDFVDLDFLPMIGSERIYMEMLTLTFIRDDGDGGISDGPSLLIDVDNYTDFGPDGLVKTNKTPVTYVINLQQDLGLTQGDFEQILDDMAFSMLVTVHSYMERTSSGVARYRNTLESLGDYSAGTSANGFAGADGLPVNALTFDLIPEPMTLALLSAGSIILLRRRKAGAA